MNKSMIYLRQILAVCFLVVAFAACDNDNNEVSDSNVTLVSPTEGIQCLAEQSIHTVRFSAEGNWSAVPSQGWIRLNQIQGTSGEQEIEVTVAPNETFQERTGVVLVKDKESGKSFEVAVKQFAKNVVFGFDAPELTLSIDSEKKEILGTVKITSNYNWKISIPQEVTWLTYLEGEAEGSTRTITFYADPEKIEGYDAKEVKVNFDYVTDTRAPGNKEYVVRFAGIEPKVELNVEQANLNYDYGKDVYNARVVVASNIAWKFGNTPDFITAEITNNDDPSQRFFETQSIFFITLKDKKLDTDELKGNLQIIDATTQTEVKALPVFFAGVGNEYISFDRQVFASTDPMAPGFMFDAKGTWDEQGNNSNWKNFVVKASQPEDVVCYFFKAFNHWSAPLDLEIRFAGVDLVETRGKNTRSVVGQQNYSMWISDRQPYEYESSKDRFFSMFVVSKKAAPDAASIFDADGNVKPEFEDKYITLGQKGLIPNYYFYSEDVAEGQIFEIPAKGKTFTINYECDTEALSMYYEIKKKPNGSWSGNYGTGDIMVATFEGSSIKLAVSPNTTGTERVETYGIAAYTGVGDGQLLITFKVKQAAE